MSPCLFLLRTVLFSGIVLILGNSLPLSAQSATSSGVAGRVLDPAGRGIAGSSVEVRLEETGWVQTAETDSGGRFRFLGLRVGGPYVLTVSAPGYTRAIEGNIILALGQTRNVDVTLVSDDDDVFELDDFEVRAVEQSFLFSSDFMGSGSTLDGEAIAALPSVTRSLSDITRMDPRMAIFDRDTGQVSAGGKNTRYNSLLIDGVPTNDTFGLSPSGLPAQKQPFSLEAIAEVSVRLSPYDVEKAGFTGASISAVTRSGTNEFRGSTFGYYRNDSMVGKLNQVDSDIPITFPEFTEYTVGATLGGPIIKDRLFFFALYEKVEETFVGQEVNIIPDATVVQNIIDAARFYSTPFDIGEIREPGQNSLKDDKYFLKLDWFINENHRLTARYNRVVGRDPVFPGAPNTSFTSAWYTWESLLEDYTFELFSRFGDSFSSELRFSLKTQSRLRSHAEILPHITIQSVPNRYAGPLSRPDTATLSLGANQLSELEVDTTLLHWKGSYSRGRHEISFGLQYEAVDNLNLFLRNPKGSWRFDNPIFFLRALGFDNNGIPLDPSNAAGFQMETPAPGFSGAADFKLTNLGLFLQDDWRVNDRLRLNLGVRIDIPFVNRAPPEARASIEAQPRSFEEVFGVSNQNTIDGNYVIQPRVGFNYAFDDERRIQVRGGAGLFYGTAPHVWLSSTYVDNGLTKVFYNTGARQDSPPVNLTPEETAQWMNEAYFADIGDPTQTGDVNVNYLADNFKMPTDWKSNLAFDFRNPATGMTLTLEGAWSWTAYDIHYVHQNLRLEERDLFVGRLPDGRELYTNATVGVDPSFRWREPGYRDVFELRNTTKGRGYQYTFQLDHPMRENLSWRIGYTFSRSLTVTDGTAASAFANWANNTAFNPNDDILGTSSFETRHRVIGSLTYRIRWSERHRTRVTLVYDGRSGRPYSYHVGGVNLDLNRDGVGDNDLLYIPSDLDDPLVSWGNNNQFRDTEGVAFMNFVERTPGLAQYKGQVVPRNTGRAPNIHQFDLNLNHEIKLWGGHRLELMLNIQNIGNLINDSWGLEKRPRGGNHVNVLSDAAHFPFQNPRTGKGGEFGYYTYRFRELTERDLYVHPRGLASRWAAQVGFRYRF
ncbi:MAG: TonB-dependent receptor [Opitutales bacterium]|nr:TonB-dependent receptor [Opitutales bacterium]